VLIHITESEELVVDTVRVLSLVSRIGHTTIGRAPSLSLEATSILDGTIMMVIM
jgi:hypothetical protein